MFYVYVLQSVDEKRDKYIGFTSDLRKRDLMRTIHQETEGIHADDNGG